MKKWILLFAAGFSSISINACDVCGCAAATPGSDVLPGIFSNFIGFRSQIRTFHSTHLPLFNESPWESQEQFLSMELHGRYSPVRKLQFLGSLPFHQINKNELGNDYQIQGLGDLFLRTNYLLIDRKNLEADKVTNLFLGAAIKSATGRSEFDIEIQQAFNRNMYPGSGTWDYGFHTDFIHRNASWGIMSTQMIYLRGIRKDLYAFGNMFQGSISGFYLEKLKNTAIMMEFGATVLHSSQDVDLRFNEVNPYTGGTLVSTSFRVNAFIGNFIITGGLQTPIYQNLAQGLVQNRISASLNIIYQFNTTKND